MRESSPCDDRILRSSSGPSQWPSSSEERIMTEEADAPFAAWLIPTEAAPPDELCMAMSPLLAVRCPPFVVVVSSIGAARYCCCSDRFVSLHVVAAFFGLSMKKWAR